MKKENERVVKENNELHMKVIGLQEECEQRENAMKAKLKQALNEKADLQFLSSQKDLKIKELDKQLVDMQAKLEKVLQKVFNPQANDIVKGLRKEINQQENIVTRKQEFTVSRGLHPSASNDSQNVDPNMSA